MSQSIDPVLPRLAADTPITTARCDNSQCAVTLTATHDATPERMSAAASLLGWRVDLSAQPYRHWCPIHKATP